MKKLLGILIINLIFLSPSYSDTTNMFCIVNMLDLKKAKVDPKDHDRFAGKVIKLEINLDENLLYDVSSEGELIVLSGINEGVINFEKTGEGLKYSNKFELRGDEGKIIEYKYNNILNINAGATSGRLKARIDQTGLSLKSFNFSFPCRSYDYNEKELTIAKYAALLPGMSFSSTKRKPTKKIDYDWSKLDENKNENNILDLKTYVAKDIDSLLNLYKAKLFENKIDNSIFLKNRRYLNFEAGQAITFEDIRNLDERQFFRLPFHNSKDKDKLKKLKKEYLINKKSIDKVG